MPERQQPRNARRAARACVACQRRKIRCDNVRPRCGYCASVDAPECTFLETRQRPGPAPGFRKEMTKRVHALEEFYSAVVALVEQKTLAPIPTMPKEPTAECLKTATIITELQLLIGIASPQLVKRNENANSSRSGSQEYQETSHESKRDHLSDESDSKDTAVFSPETMNESLSVDGDNILRVHGPSSGLQLLDIVDNNPPGYHDRHPLSVPETARATATAAVWNQKFAGFSKKVATLRLGLPALALNAEDSIFSSFPMESHSVELQDSILTNYWDDSSKLLPLIRKSSFLAKLYASRAAIDEERDISLQLLLNSIAAVTTLYNPEIPGAYVSKVYYDAVLHVVQQTYPSRQSSVELAQAMALMSLYDLHRGFFVPAWHLIGSATQIAIDLGLYLNVEKRIQPRCISSTNTAANNEGAAVTRESIEIRKIAWWGIYVQATEVSMVLGRPVLIPGAVVDIDFPTPPMALSPERGATQLLVGIGAGDTYFLQIQALLHRQQNSIVENFYFANSPGRKSIEASELLRHRLTSELESIWDKIKLSRAASGITEHAAYERKGFQNLIITITYHLSTILLNRPFVDWRGASQNNPCRLAATSSAIAIQKIFEHINNSCPGGLKRSGIIPYIAFTILVIHASNANLPPSATVCNNAVYKESVGCMKEAVRFLKELKDGWVIAGDGPADDPLASDQPLSQAQKRQRQQPTKKKHEQSFPGTGSSRQSNSPTPSSRSTLSSQYPSDMSMHMDISVPEPQPQSVAQHSHSHQPSPDIPEYPSWYDFAATNTAELGVVPWPQQQQQQHPIIDHEAWSAQTQQGYYQGFPAGPFMTRDPWFPQLEEDFLMPLTDAGTQSHSHSAKGTGQGPPPHNQGQSGEQHHRQYSRHS